MEFNYTFDDIIKIKNNYENLNFPIQNKTDDDLNCIKKNPWIILLLPFILPGVFTLELTEWYSNVMNNTPNYRENSGMISMIILIWPIVLPFITADFLYNLITFNFYNKFKIYKQTQNNIKQKINIKLTKEKEEKIKNILKYNKLKDDYNNYIKYSKLYKCIKCCKNEISELMCQLVNNEYECMDCNIIL